MVKLNPLVKTNAQVVGLDQRLKMMNNSFSWASVVRSYKKSGKVFDPTLRPRVAMIQLSKIKIDEDIQRDLDPQHVSKIASQELFDPRLLQTIFCAKMPGKNEYHAVDGQHTATVIAAMVQAGLFVGEDDWTTVEVAVSYIETSDKSFARRAFDTINGSGKKRQSRWGRHRIRVQSVRIDGSKEEKMVEAERKQTICETNHCWPVEQKSPYEGKSGTFTHMEALSLDEDVLAATCKWHNQFFHYQPIDGGLWFTLPKIIKTFQRENVVLDDKLKEDLAGIVQTLFGGVAQFHSMVKKAHERYSMKIWSYNHTDEVEWNSDSLPASLIQLYKRLGGTQKVPAALMQQFDGITDFFLPEIRQWYVN